MSNLVAVLLDGKMSVHIAGAASDYDTLCGIDASDPAIGHEPARLPYRAKINCETCRNIWTAARAVRASAFESVS